MAIRRSSRGPVPGQAPNVFYVNRESFENLKNNAEGRPANLFYVVSPGLLFDLYICPNKELLRQAIVENGCKHARNQSANVFIINQEWAGVLKSAGGALVTDFKYVVEGDEITNVHDSSLGRDAVKNAINKLECRHVMGNPIANIYWVSQEDHRLLWDKYLEGLQPKKEEKSGWGEVIGGGLLMAAIVGFGLHAESKMTPEEYARNQKEKKEWGM